MGVDLGDLVVSEPRTLADYKGKIVAIDAYNTLYQFLAIIRQPDGTPLKDSRGRITSHLSGLLYRGANLAEAGVKAVYVFDGPPHRLKAATLDLRRDRKVKAEAEYKGAIEAGDTARAFSKAQQTSRLTNEMVEQAKDLLVALGVPFLDAPGEGEAQAAHMAAKGDAWASASQDYDSLLFGSPRFVRNMTVTGRRKLPRKSVYVDVNPEEVTSEVVFTTLGLTRAEVVDLAILIGTDFNAKVPNVGPKRAIALIKEHGTAEKALAHVGHAIPDLDEIRGIFLRPNVTDTYELRFGSVDEGRVTEILCEEHGFSKDRVTATFARYAALTDMAKQRSLESFF
ncbi:MAG: flap endonuclease-1 [Thermoplasmatota archaeon]